MSDLVLAGVPLLPSTVCLLLALVACVCYWLIRTRRLLRIFGWFLLVALLGASTPLWPIPGLPRETPVWSWTTASGLLLSLGLDLGSAADADKGALSLLLLLLGAFGCWSICQLPVAAQNVRQRAAGLPGLLVVLAGSQVVAQSVAPFGAVLGVAVVMLGSILLDLLSPTRRSLLQEIVRVIVLLVPLVAVGYAVGVDPTLASTYAWWIIGCAGLLSFSLVAAVSGRSPLLLSGTIQAVGLPPLAVWLLLWTNLIEPARSAIMVASTTVGALVFVVGAINVAVASSVRGVFYAQMLAQFGLLSLSLGLPEFTPALAHMLVASLLLSLVLGWLAEAAGSERIADLATFPQPMRHPALAYALAAASISGLPFTLGYSLRRQLAAQIDAVYVAPLLLGGSTLLVCGLIPPLAALIRTSAHVSPQPSVEPRVASSGPSLVLINTADLPKIDATSASTEATEPIEASDAPTADPASEAIEMPDAGMPVEQDGVTEQAAATAETPEAALQGAWRSGIVLGLVLICTASYPALLDLDAAPLGQPFEAAMLVLRAEQAALISAGLRIGLVLLMLGFASRGLRRLAVHPPFNMPISQVGWALPAAGLAEVVAPLTAGFWVGLDRRHPRWTRVLLATLLIAVVLLTWWGIMWHR